VRASEPLTRAMEPRIVYVEIPATNFEDSKTFYASAFGWTLTDYGPSYSGTEGFAVNIGLQGDETEATTAPLAVIDVGDLESALDAVTRAGGTVTRPIFAFPGGRRFQFMDPSGNELAVMQQA